MTYEEYLKLVKDKIVAVLEKGINPWQAPWQSAANGLSGRPYSGTNALLLSLVADEKFNCDPRYYTFDQVKKMGNSVKKNEHSTPAVFFQDRFYVNKKDDAGNIIKDKDGKPEKELVKGKPILKIYPVFNAQQLVNVPELVEIHAPTFNEKKANEILNNSPVKIKFSSLPRAFYNPSTDEITMPTIVSFKGNTEEYFSTAFHEMTHSTGSPDRLNRFKEGPTDGKSYAREELVAEISSLGLCDKCGAKYTNESSASYIGFWKDMLQDPNFDFSNLFTDVSKATRFLEHPEDRDKLITTTRNMEKYKSQKNEINSETVKEKKPLFSFKHKDKSKKEEQSRSLSKKTTLVR